MLDSTRKKLIILGFLCCTYILFLSLFVHYEKINLDKLKIITNNLDNSPILDISLSENGKCNNSKKMILGHHKTKIENCNCNGKFSFKQSLFCKVSIKPQFLKPILQLLSLSMI